MLSPLRWDDDVVFKNCAKGEPKNKVDIYQLVNKVWNFVNYAENLNIPMDFNNLSSLCQCTTGGQ